MTRHAALDRNRAIDVWMSGYIHLRTPIDGAVVHEHAGLTYARFPLPVRPVQGEFFIREPAPEHDAARAIASGVGTHWLAVFEQHEAERTDYRALGYTLVTVEYLMARPIGHDEQIVADEHVQRLSDPSFALTIGAVSGYRAFVPEHFADPAISLVGVMASEQLVAWGSNVWAHPEIPYVSRVFTQPDYRRRGFASQIMQSLLHEAMVRRATHSVLSATEMARPLYARLGYQQLATMHIWRSPIERGDS